MRIDYPRHVRILAIDIATRTGWASLEMGRIQTGVFHAQRKTKRKAMKDEPEGTEYLRFHQWLMTKMQEVSPDWLVMEQQGGTMQNVNASRKLFGFAGIAMAQVAYFKPRFLPVAPTSLKRYATGSGRAKKPAMIAACAANYGIPTKDDNVADALHLLHLCLSSKYGFETAPLEFTGQRTTAC